MEEILAKKILTIELKIDIERVLNTLTKREKEIIELRFGLNGNLCQTFKEIAKKFNLSDERIRQIEKRAILRLQRPSRIRYLKGED